MRLFVFSILIVLGAVLPAVAAHANGAVEPTYGVAVVDGAYGEWNLDEDYFCAMYLDGDAAQPLVAKIYFRYDCETGTMYVLVLGEPTSPVPLLPHEVWIAVAGRNGKVFDGDPYNDGPPSDFAWVDLTFGDWVYAWGYEGKFPLFEGAHELIFHMISYYQGQLRTAATPGFPDQGCWVMINCGATPVESTSWGRIKQIY